MTDHHLLCSIFMDQQKAVIDLCRVHSLMHMLDCYNNNNSSIALIPKMIWGRPLTVNVRFFVQEVVNKMHETQAVSACFKVVQQTSLIVLFFPEALSQGGW